MQVFKSYTCKQYNKDHQKDPSSWFRNKTQNAQMQFSLNNGNFAVKPAAGYSSWTTGV